MANAIKWTTPTSRTTGIAAPSLSAGANYLGSAIDNDTNKDRWLHLDIEMTHGSSPTANTVHEIYLIYAIDGTNYEDGGVSVDPSKNPTLLFAVKAQTTTQRQSFVNIPIAPFKFKILIKSEVSQTATPTILAYTSNEEVQ